MKRRPTVSLALGSGGARGLAHIGVIQWLEEQGYRIQCIAGASMGAVVGGLYAAGHLDTYTRWVSALDRTDVLRLMDFTFAPDGLLRGERVFGLLRELVGDPKIEALPIAFTAVATDLDNQREVWLNRGPLFRALRASVAIPTLLPPVELAGRRLVDGGLLDPIPIAPTYATPTDLTVAVSTHGRALREPPPERPPPPPPEDEEIFDAVRRRIEELVRSLGRSDEGRPSRLVSLGELVVRSLDTMQMTIARSKLAAFVPDVVIEIPRNVCLFFDFHRAPELIEIGRERAAAAFADLPDPG